MHVSGMVSAGNPDSRKTEERQGVSPIPADLDLLAKLRLDACSSPNLMLEQYRVRLCHCLIWTSAMLMCTFLATQAHTARSLLPPHADRASVKGVLLL